MSVDLFQPKSSVCTRLGEWQVSLNGGNLAMFTAYSLIL
jgi:hypothetical protein